MIWFTLIIPILAAVILLTVFNRRTKWWELLIILAVSPLVVALFNHIFVGYRVSTGEYWGGYVTKIYHSEHWNEWINQTCTESYACGTDSKGNTTYCTRTYDCSYCKDHPEYWEMYDNNGETYSITEATYKRIQTQFGTKESFIDKHRDYYTINGNAYDCSFDGNKDKAEITTTHHTYVNRIRVSNSIYNVEKPDTSTIKKYGLFPYPKLNGYYQTSVIGYKGDDYAAVDKRFQIINGMLGKTKQVRVFVVVFYDKPIDVAAAQRAYWQGGNKNELNVTIGVDSKTGNVQWCYCYSWCKEPKMETLTQQYVMMNKPLNLIKLADFIYDEVPSNWERRHFKEFEYLSVEPNGIQLAFMWIIIIILNGGFCVWVVLNHEVESNVYNNSNTTFSMVWDWIKRKLLK